jgi:polyhydroxyalkanoate synthesis regulator phasin
MIRNIEETVSPMAGFGDLVKKAFYLGVGVASYAGEKAGITLKDLREQTQTIVNELVARGEMTAEEAQRLINDMVNQAQADAPPRPAGDTAPQPRRIEILDDEEGAITPPEQQTTESLKRQVEALRQELNNLKQSKGNL